MFPHRCLAPFPPLNLERTKRRERERLTSRRGERYAKKTFEMKLGEGRGWRNAYAGGARLILGQRPRNFCCFGFSAVVAVESMC